MNKLQRHLISPSDGNDTKTIYHMQTVPHLSHLPALGLTWIFNTLRTILH